ncbi:MAG: threonylcarbamoyl-AMP synthase [Bacteroidales bacterium]|nr:threonylcarbamoyl-AMP synthase [Bacteroidales bacterium]
MKESIENAVRVLREGGLILYPTDTVWGIGCDATNEKAVEKVFALKQRSDSKSLIVLAESLDMVAQYVQELPPMAEQLTEVSDSPLTIIYPGALGLAPNVIAQDGSVAIRIPDHEFCRQMLHRFRKPIVSTSANISGEKTAIHLQDVADAILKGVDFSVDSRFEGNPTGKPSSIIMLGLHYEVKVIR